MNKEKILNYLGNRGMMDAVKRCARFENLLFVIWADMPDEVEISVICGCYECYEIYPAKGFAWRKSNYCLIKKSLNL